MRQPAPRARPSRASDVRILGSENTVPGVRAFLRAARARAYTRLRNALEFPIALVSAPTGFGKTTVVSDVLAAGGNAHRMIKIAPGNGDMLGLLRALATGVGDVAPALSSSFVTVYDRLASKPDASDHLAAWAAGCLTALDGLVVIDKVEGTFDEPAAALLAGLIDRTRSTLRWVVISQSSQGFPVARWMAEDRVGAPVDAVDLAFRTDDLLTAAGPHADPLARRQFRQLEKVTNGWPAAITLALAGRALADLHVVPREPAALYAYFGEALLAGMGARTRAFVEATCLFGTFDTALLECAHLHDVEDVLAELCDETGILTRDPSGSYAYDWHIRSFLIERLSASSDGAFPRVAARSAAAYEGDGQYAAAIEVYRTLGDQKALCLLLSAHGYALIDRGESGAVQRALAAIPHEVLLTYPAALAVKASLESLHGKADIAEAWFRLALDRSIDPAQRNEIVYRFGVDLVRRERPDAVELLLPVVATIDHAAPLAAPLLALLASAYACNGAAADAKLAIDDAMLLLPHIHDRATRAKIVCQAGFVALHLGNVDAAKALAHEAYAQAMTTCSYDVAARALSVSYSVSIDHDDDIAASRRFIERLSDAGARAGSRELLLYATLCRYEIEAYAGDLTEIARLNDQLASLEVYYSVLTMETLLPSQALEVSWSGDFYRAYQLLEASAERQITAERRAHRYAEIALYAAAAGLRHEASAAVEMALANVRESRPADKTLLYARAYIALTMVLLQRRSRAGVALGELAAQTAGHPRVDLLVRVVRALSDRWTSRSGAIELSTALEALEGADLGGLARMIEALPLPQRGIGAGAELTPAERDVLATIAAGHSSKHIAMASGRTVATVDAHVASICRKLGCHGRRHAVAIARSEGLIPAVSAPDYVHR